MLENVFDDFGLLVILAALLESAQVKELLDKDFFSEAPFSFLFFKALLSIIVVFLFIEQIVNDLQKVVA